jgi:hypothetical protein
MGREIDTERNLSATTSRFKDTKEHQMGKVQEMSVKKRTNEKL